MTIEQVFNDKSIKAKGKVSLIGEWLLNGELPVEELMAHAEKQKASDKATCIEAMEYATKKNASIADETLLSYVTLALRSEEPRIKWESAKVIGNIAKHFPDQLEKPVAGLLINAANPGTVVRWATAYALAEIIKLKKKSTIKSCYPKLNNSQKKKRTAG